MSDGSASRRLDKWLWFARVARTRSLAAKLCAAGQIRVGAAVALKPHQPVRVGDWITIADGRTRRRLRVVALGARRGPAAEARGLYDEPAPPLRQHEDEGAAWEPLLDEGMAH
jgi:ribosome-associated heat shock protein Hsp15